MSSAGRGSEFGRRAAVIFEVGMISSFLEQASLGEIRL